MSKKLWAVPAGLLVALASLPASAGDSRPVQLTPGVGQTLRAGTEVTITWNAELPRCVRNFFGEQEINLSIDGGRTFPYRITPRLGYGDRTYVWRVPNLPTGEAILDLRYGCENEPGECEPYRTVVDAFNPQFESRFRIAASRADYVGHPLVSASRNPRPGDTVQLKWDAQVSNLDHYEVLASTDRGGQFARVGTSTTASFVWTVPSDGVRCSFFFKVVAVLTDGTRIESVVDTSQLVYVAAGG